MSEWLKNNKENIKLILKIIIGIFVILFIIFALGEIILYIFPPKPVNSINTIELTIRGQTGNEEYTIESLTGDILVPKRLAPKDGEVIKFNTNLSNIILNRFRSKSGGELFLRKIEKNKQVFPITRISSIIRGDLHFNNMTDEAGKISRQQDINEGKLKWPVKYQIDIGL